VGGPDNAEKTTVCVATTAVGGWGNMAYTNCRYSSLQIFGENPLPGFQGDLSFNPAGTTDVRVGYGASDE